MKKKSLAPPPRTVALSFFRGVGNLPDYGRLPLDLLLDELTPEAPLREAAFLAGAAAALETGRGLSPWATLLEEVQLVLEAAARLQLAAAHLAEALRRCRPPESREDPRTEVSAWVENFPKIAQNQYRRNNISKSEIKYLEGQGPYPPRYGLHPCHARVFRELEAMREKLRQAEAWSRLAREKEGDEKP